MADFRKTTTYQKFTISHPSWLLDLTECVNHFQAIRAGTLNIPKSSPTADDDVEMNDGLARQRWQPDQRAWNPVTTEVMNHVGLFDNLDSSLVLTTHEPLWIRISHRPRHHEPTTFAPNELS